MNYRIDYLDDKVVVKIDIEGVVNFSMAQQYSKDARKLAHEYNCRKFLFDHSRTQPEAGQYKVHTDGNALEKFGFKSTDKIAIVISAGRNDNHYAEDTDSNVRWSKIRYFNSIEKAFEWLAEED